MWSAIRGGATTHDTGPYPRQSRALIVRSAGARATRALTPARTAWDAAARSDCCCGRLATKVGAGNGRRFAHCASDGPPGRAPERRQVGAQENPRGRESWSSVRVPAGGHQH
jgi:hypothetical protein